MKLPASTKIIPGLLLGGGLLALLLGYFFLAHQYRLESAMLAEQHLSNLEVAYQGAIETHRFSTITSLRATVLRPEVLELLAAALETPEGEMSPLRGRLYRLLLPEYQQLRTNGLDIFQFHLADDRVLLRFHRPYKAGDRLFDLRPSLRIANSELRPVSGLETGRSHHGFRYVYPVAVNERHLGSVEYAMPFDFVHQQLLGLLGPGDYLFLLRADDVRAKVDREQQERFATATLHPEFLLENPSLAVVSRRFRHSELAEQLSAGLRRNAEVQRRMAAGETFALPFFHDGRSYVASMLAVQDIARQPAAYIIGFNEAPVLKAMLRAKIRDGLAAALGIILLTCVLWRLMSQRDLLRREIVVRRQSERDKALLLRRQENSYREYRRLYEVMAHHLQEPARRVTIYAQMLRQQAGKQLWLQDLRAGQALDFIEREASRLKTLLNNIQQYLHVEAASPDSGAISGRREIEQVCRDLQAADGAGGLQITTGYLPDLPLTSANTRLLFSTILHNAVTHADPERPVLIRIAGEREGRLVCYRIADNGPGIAPHYREKVFDLFARLDTARPGTGLGLAIARRLVEKHGGEIRLADSDLGGLAVIFELPFPDET